MRCNGPLGPLHRETLPLALDLPAQTGSATPAHVPTHGFRSWDELRAAARVDRLVPDLDDAVRLVVLFGRAPTLPERATFARARRRRSSSTRCDAMAARDTLTDALRTMVDAWFAIWRRVPDGAARLTLVELLDDAARTAEAAHAAPDTVVALHHARAAHARAHDALGLALAYPAR